MDHYKYDDTSKVWRYSHSTPGLFPSAFHSMKPSFNRTKRGLGAIFSVLFLSVFMLAAVTQIDLTTQVKNLLPKTNGGTGISSTAIFPASGTVMITTTGVTASQLPNPSASTLGGVESGDCTGTGHVLAITTSGVITCSADAGGGNSAIREIPSGTINGANTSFVLTHTPSPVGGESCYLNGNGQQSGAGNDYTISGATITYLAAPPTGEKLWCSYTW
jgi:hypothetical protein